jgi:hypothetical protein
MARLDGQRFASLALDVFRIVRENKFENETFVNAFSRLIGLIPNLDPSEIKGFAGDISTRTDQKLLDASDEDQNVEISTGQAGKTIVDGLFKSRDENLIRIRQLVAAYIENLVNFVERWARSQRGQQFRRIQRLIGNIPVDPFDPSFVGIDSISAVELHRSTEGAGGLRVETVDIAEVVRAINDGLKEIELSKENRAVGKLTLQQSLFNLVLAQLSALISSIPQSRLGELGGTLISLIQAPVEGLERVGRKMSAQRRTLGVELTQLQEQSALIVDGITLSTGEKISLLSILRALQFLASKIEYRCKDCKFFTQGEQIDPLLPPGVTRENPTFGGICTFGSEGQSGRAAQEREHCGIVWGLPGNDYWTANDDVIEKFLDELVIKEGDENVV